jgi:hypothetical protein
MLQGTLESLLQADTQSCYYALYKKLGRDPFKWALIWSTFPLSEKLCETAMEVLLQFTSSLEATFTPSYDKAHYILYPELMILLLMEHLQVDKQTAECLYKNGDSISRLINCALKVCCQTGTLTYIDNVCYCVGFLYHSLQLGSTEINTWTGDATEKVLYYVYSLCHCSDVRT